MQYAHKLEMIIEYKRLFRYFPQKKASRPLVNHIDIIGFNAGGGLKRTI